MNEKENNMLILDFCCKSLKLSIWGVVSGQINLENNKKNETKYFC